MYAKLVNNNLEYAPHYIVTNSGIILNPQEENYLQLGYKPLEKEPIPLMEIGKSPNREIVEQEDKILIKYTLVENQTTHFTEEEQTDL